MDASHRNLSTLFNQLGLSDSEPEMWRFIREHCSLKRGQRIEQAEFWNAAQSAFLNEAIA